MRWTASKACARIVSINEKFVSDAISVLQKDLDSLYCSETVANRIHGFLLLIGQLVQQGNMVNDVKFLIHVILPYICIESII